MSDGGGAADRDDDGARYYWHRAVEWIEGNGGYVHPSLRHDRGRRIVRLGDDDEVVDDDGGGGSGGGGGDDDVGGGARTTSAVVVALFDAGTKILDVPDACLLTLHTVVADESFGGGMLDAVHSVAEKGGSTIIALGGSSSSAATTTTTTGDGKKDHDNHHRDGECGGLYHDAKDVILALYLAHIIAGRRREGGDRSSAPWSFHGPYLATLPSGPPPDRALPRQWTDADLRRRLSGTSLLNTVLREKMGLEREYRCIEEAYYSSKKKKKKKKKKRPSLCADTSSASCRDDDDDGRKEFPSFEEYDAALAFVTSRVFEGLGRDGVDAMVPLLDLLDHVRGPSDEGGGNVGGTGYDRRPPSPGDDGGPDDDPSVERCRRDGHASDETSVDASRCQDIGYGRDEDDEDHNEADDDDGGDHNIPPKRRRIAEGSSDGSSRAEGGGGGGGGVLVYTTRSLPAGSTLRMTYGAKGNAALLSRYGFAIHNNAEPDGSCNDVLEVEIDADGERPVGLHRGPVSYSYGPLARALELCRDGSSARDRVPSGSSGVRSREEVARDCAEVDNGLRDFPDPCDDSSDDDAADNGDDDNASAEGDDSDCSHDAIEISVSEQYDPSARRSIIDDIGAIDVFRERLRNVRAGLVNNPLSGPPHGEIFTVEDRYCSILIDSEIQTIDFFLSAVRELRNRLEERITEERREPTRIGSVSEDDGCIRERTLRDQITSVATSFLSIRYP